MLLNVGGAIEFKHQMDKLGIEMARSEVAYTVNKNIEKIAEELKYAVTIHAYTMGGVGKELLRYRRT